MKINIPEWAWSHFWEEPPPDALEFWEKNYSFIIKESWLLGLWYTRSNPPAFLNVRLLPNLDIAGKFFGPREAFRI